jgi:hypothetical protein
VTSEVIVLNKRGVVIAADSAVTTSGSNGNHPRYSKTANKIFDISRHGNVAVTIFANADIDGVPWDVVFKEFRSSDGAQGRLNALDDYVESLKRFLIGHPQLFPAKHLGTLKEALLQKAAAHILSQAQKLQPDFVDEKKSMQERVTAWNKASGDIRNRLQTASIHSTLSTTEFTSTLAGSSQLAANLHTQIAASPLASVITNAQLLAELAIGALYKEPMLFLEFTGLVISGYGEQDIFPSYKTLHVYGHIGNELLVDVPAFRGTDYAGRAISHENGAWIQAFAQSSMIDVFTDGFGYSLHKIIREKSKAALVSLVDQLVSSGIAVPPAVAAPIIENTFDAFQKDWQQKNYDENFQPLISVLGGLSLQEMSDLAETLLTLESLKERVTSPSESVGGPIDVAVITRAEGLVWVKRKHYFDPELNLRYLNRVGSR